MFVRAIDNLRAFHLILVLEWIDSAAPLLENSLGWKTPPKQVLPHEVQALRGDKKSKAAKDMLPSEDYEYLACDNVFDLLLFVVVKRMYLERIKCAL